MRAPLASLCWADKFGTHLEYGVQNQVGLGFVGKVKSLPMFL